MLDDRLLKTRDVADYLGVHPDTLLRYWREGLIEGVQVRSNVLRFRASAVERFVAQRTREAAE